MSEISFECPHCGKSVKIGEEYAGKEARCPACQQVIGIPALTESHDPVRLPEVAYAFLWERFGAGMADFGLLYLAAVQSYLILLARLDEPLEALGLPWYDPRRHALESRIGWMVLVFWALVCFLCFSFLESRWGATLGKWGFGIAVTDLSGRRMSFARALARYLMKLGSLLTLLVGFIIAAFAPKRQALHDMIVGSLVVSRESSGGGQRKSRGSIAFASLSLDYSPAVLRKRVWPHS